MSRDNRRKNQGANLRGSVKAVGHPEGQGRLAGIRKQDDREPNRAKDPAGVPGTRAPAAHAAEVSSLQQTGQEPPRLEAAKRIADENRDP
jgi:hypothetical protein